MTMTTSTTTTTIIKIHGIARNKERERYNTIRLMYFDHWRRIQEFFFWEESKLAHTITSILYGHYTLLFNQCAPPPPPPPNQAQNKFIISIHSAIKFYKQLWSDNNNNNIYRGSPTRQGGFQWGPQALI